MSADVCAGMLSAIVSTPAETIVVQQQRNASSLTSEMTRLCTTMSPLNLYRGMVRTRGSLHRERETDREERIEGEATIVRTLALTDVVCMLTCAPLFVFPLVRPLPSTAIDA